MPTSIQRLLFPTLFTVAFACGGSTAPEVHDGGAPDWVAIQRADDLALNSRALRLRVQSHGD